MLSRPWFASWLASAVTLLIAIPSALFALLFLPRLPSGLLQIAQWAAMGALCGAASGYAAAIARDHVAADGMKTRADAVATRAALAALIPAAIIGLVGPWLAFLAGMILLPASVLVIPVLCARWAERMRD